MCRPEAGASTRCGAERDAGMLVAGVDVGAATAKTVILGDGKILGYAVRPVGYDVKLAANEVSKEALDRAGLSISMDDLDYVVSTGYARESIEFTNKTVTEIICHAKGAYYMIPSARFIIDMGGQDSKAIELDPKGNITNFVMNDKCAAGTGRFLEIMAKVIQLPLEDIGKLSLQARNEIKINSTCTVFGKSEVASLIRQGRDKRDVLAGLHVAISNRVYNLLRRVGIKPDFTITGGIAKNIGVVHRLEEKVDLKALLPEEPQIVGALGAAIFARDRLSNK